MQVGVVGMTRTKGLQNIAVVFAALVCIFNKQANRCASGFTLVHARQNLNRIGLVSLRNVPTGAGAATVKVSLNIGLA